MADDMATTPAQLLATMNTLWRDDYVPRIPESAEAIISLQLALDFLARMAQAASIDSEPGSEAQALSVLFGVATVGTWVAELSGYHGDDPL